ncbi:MAG TPA: spore coat U domain-containing protein [Anaeromyxobacteraceae bacterium]|jgi:spore coat protein U-like protein|nr:spore coat U domain-containing protein [Anaeromyxobacteraceae bacterium]
MKLLKTSLAAAVLALAAPRAAHAGANSSSFSVTATVAQNCTITTSPLAFGSYDPIVANAAAAQSLDATTSLSVACTKGASAVTIALDAGTSTNRTMKDTASTGTLSYQLYSDSARSSVWDATTTVSYAPTSKVATPFTVYGRVPGGQDAPVGSGYADTVKATVNF